MAQTLHTLSIISFVGAGICLVLAVFFWFYFKIPKVYGDLSGRTARKSIATMRAANEKSGNKSYKESKTNQGRGKLTDTMQGLGKLKKKKPEKDNNVPETGILTENKANRSEPEMTESMFDETTSILGSGTTGLLVDENATEPLNVTAHRSLERASARKLEVIDEVMFIHTEEVLE